MEKIQTQREEKKNRIEEINENERIAYQHIHSNDDDKKEMNEKFLYSFH